ncbi:MAG: hypothetical protein FD122_3737, partial [Stygiobacter sp.]
PRLSARYRSPKTGAGELGVMRLWLSDLLNIGYTVGKIKM